MKCIPQKTKLANKLFNESMKKKSKKAVKKPELSKEELAEAIEEFDGVIRKRFKKWKEKHSVVSVHSCLIKDPIDLMMIAMSSDFEENM